MLPETVTVDPGSIIPLLGLTQYRRGAVVFTLKHTFLSDGFRNLRFVVTTSVKGPVKFENPKQEKKFNWIVSHTEQNSKLNVHNLNSI